MKVEWNSSPIAIVVSSHQPSVSNEMTQVPIVDEKLYIIIHDAHDDNEKVAG